MKRKATTWNYCYPDDPHPGLLHLEPPALSGAASFWVQCGQCGGGTSEELDEIARRVAALWNTAAELDLDTEQIERGIIDDAFTALKEKVDEELCASYLKEMTP
jgi:hypothetical protein